MSNLKVIRKDLMLNEYQLERIYSFYDKNQVSLKPLDVELIANEFLVKVTFDYNVFNSIQVIFYLYKVDETGSKKEVLATMTPVEKENLLTKVFKINTQRSDLGENIDILIKFYDKNVVKDDLYFKTQQPVGDFYFSYKLESMSHADFNKKDELFYAMYLFLMGEDRFNEYLFSTGHLYLKESYREEINNLMLRLEYFGYDKDYYEEYTVEYENTIKDLNENYEKYSSDDILNCFILSTLGNFYENKVTSYSNDDKNNLYISFYDKLKKEGYYTI